MSSAERTAEEVRSGRICSSLQLSRAQAKAKLEETKEHSKSVVGAAVEHVKEVRAVS